MNDDLMNDDLMNGDYVNGDLMNDDYLNEAIKEVEEENYVIEGLLLDFLQDFLFQSFF
jgi:hypothetical protein